MRATAQNVRVKTRSVKPTPQRPLIMTATKSHSARVSFASLTPNNLGTVRKLNSVLFPIKYSEKFYQDILLPEAEDFCKLGASSLSFSSLQLMIDPRVLLAPQFTIMTSP